MPRIKRIIFHQYSPKIKLFLKKKRKIFKRWGLGPTPRASGGWKLCPQTPEQSPPLRISSYTSATLCSVYNYKSFRSFCLEQFFRDRSVANRVMLAIDICLMLNCFLFEKFYLHYAQCDFDSILFIAKV